MAIETTSRTLFDQIRDEHLQLDWSFERVRTALARRRMESGALARLFVELVRMVERHFEHEEEGGYYNDVVEHAPHFSADVERLKQQHNSLLESLKKISRLAASGDGSAPWWRTMRVDFHEFVCCCDKHEALENDIVQRAYTQDIGEQD